MPSFRAQSRLQRSRGSQRGQAFRPEGNVARNATGSLDFASLEKMTKGVLLGAHMSIAGGAHLAIERACSINCTAMQIFVKNNMQWFARPLSTEEIRAFLDHQQRAQLASVFAHANYLINPAATNPQFHANSLRALAEELIRADQFELPFLVMHPGAHLGAGEEAGLEKIAASIDAIWRVIPKVKTKIALETTAGQGSCLGHRFEQIAHVINNVREPERLCICLDTAHIFAAGYDLGSEFAMKKTFREFDRVIGRDRLAAVHLNDSKAARGSHVDRHAHIGKGTIGLAAFRFIMNEARFRKIPKVLETPKGKELKEDVVNLRRLRKLIVSSASFRAKSRDPVAQSLR
jgi:deoxyribonuclease-4